MYLMLVFKLKAFARLLEKPSIPVQMTVKLIAYPKITFEWIKLVSFIKSPFWDDDKIKHGCHGHDSDRRYEVGQGGILRMPERIDFVHDVTKCPPHHWNVRYKKLKKQESPLV